MDDTETGGSYGLAHGEGESTLPGDALVRLAQEIAAAVDCSECCIYERLPGRNALRAQALWSRVLTGRDVDWIGEVHDLTGALVFQRVVNERRVVRSRPNDEIDSASAYFGTMEFWGEKAAIWAPIVHGDEVLGVMELTEKEREREFSEEDEILVERMAGLAGVALHSARLSRAAEARNRQLTALITAAQAMTSILDLDELLQVVSHQVAQALEVSSSYIYAYEPETGAVVWLAEHQSDPSRSFDDTVGTTYALEELPQAAAVVRTRQPVEVRTDDRHVEPGMRTELEDWGEQSSLMVPLLLGDALVGVLEVCETTYARHFSEEEIALCVALGEHAAVAIHNAQLYQELREQKETIERQATIDGLTGLTNQRCFWERLRDEVLRAVRYGQPLSLLMLDLDDFKRVNDRFGHPVGDELLRAVGRALRAHVRQGADCAARYGGEEFAVILPSTDSQSRDGGADGAVTMAERIRRTIAGLRLPAADAEGASAAVPAWGSVTVSIGVATIPAHAGSAEDLVARADQALYRAKAGGKDCVMVYRAPSPRQ